MPLDAWLDDDVLQAIAEENNVAETAFITACQASRRGGHVDCEAAGDRAILRGRCVTVIEGSFTL